MAVVLNLSSLLVVKTSQLIHFFQISSYLYMLKAGKISFIGILVLVLYLKFYSRFMMSMKYYKAL